MIDFLQAYILGVVEGVTEFLPISSTGHLILVGDWIRFHGHAQEFFEVFIQLGAILAVVVLYSRRFMSLLSFDGGGSTTGFTGFAGLLKLAVACAPACVVGFFFHKTIKENLFGPVTVASALIAGAILMIAVEKGRRRVEVQSVDEISVMQAFFVGLMQCLSLWPGMSRAACTIVGGLLCGMSRKVAAEFSFLVAVPIMFLAVGFDLYKNLAVLSVSDLPFFACGFSVAFLTAILAIRIFMDLLGRVSLIPFALYRIVLGFVVLMRYLVPLG